MKHYCVISHTHWDREWYQTHEEYRMRLVELMDHLLEILDEQPDYIFHMDAQTVVFEDYWEIRPENREKCCRYVAEGRMIAGPWYVQNDFFLTSGEATIRNLLIGSKQANDMGACGTTGYTPDQFGLISQLPQIFNGFGIDNCIFGRGYYDVVEGPDGLPVRKNKPSEFLWRSPDGSEVLGICMTHWYNNAQRFSGDLEKARMLVEFIENSFEGIATTPYLLLMNGVDHLEAQPDLLPILEEVQKYLPESQHIYQTTMENYIKLVSQSVDRESLGVETGELTQGLQRSSLVDTASARPYLKTQNSDLQNMLENRLEPLYTYLELAGIRNQYPAGHLNFLWKSLIRNHAHDSICGCSTDWVHRHMEDRFANIREMGLDLQNRGMRQLAAHVGTGMEPSDYQILIFNALEHPRTETIEVNVDILESEDQGALRITDGNGDAVAYTILSKARVVKSVLSPINLPGRLPVIRRKLRLLARNVPAFGYSLYRVEACPNAPVQPDASAIGFATADGYTLENPYLKVVVSNGGKVDLQVKKTGRVYRDILAVEDVADIGNAYTFIPLAGDTPIDCLKNKPVVTMEVSDCFTSRICMHYDVTLPAGIEPTRDRRSEEQVTMPLEIRLELQAEGESVDLRFDLDNRVKDHFMRALIRTGIDADVVTTSAPFDLVERNKWNIDLRENCSEAEHTSGLVSITDGRDVFSILNRGVYTYENLQREQGTLAFPLVRANGLISAYVPDADELWEIPENQCLRHVDCSLSLLPQQGESALYEAAFAAKAFQNPLLVHFNAADTRKFLGGRPGVQATTIAELFYQKLPWEEVVLPLMDSALSVEGAGLQVSALRKTIDGSRYLLRLYNLRADDVQGKICLTQNPEASFWRSNLAETEAVPLKAENGCVSLTVKSKEIATILFTID